MSKLEFSLLAIDPAPAPAAQAQAQEDGDDDYESGESLGPWYAYSKWHLITRAYPENALIALARGFDCNVTDEAEMKKAVVDYITQLTNEIKSNGYNR